MVRMGGWELFAFVWGITAATVATIMAGLWLFNK
jgi:hypothetical protein